MNHKIYMWLRIYALKRHKIHLCIFSSVIALSRLLIDRAAMNWLAATLALPLAAYGGGKMTPVAAAAAVVARTMWTNDRTCSINCLLCSSKTRSRFSKQRTYSFFFNRHSLAAERLRNRRSSWRLPPSDWNFEWWNFWFETFCR